MATKFVLEKDSAGRFKFRLLSQGRILASSESYTTKRAAQNAIASVKSGAPGAVVDDTTQPQTADRPPGRPAKAVKKTAKKTVKAAKKTVKAVKKRTRSAAKAVVAAAPAPAKRAPRKTAAAKRESAAR